MKERQNFEGLKIMSLENDWIKRPVIYLSMSLGGSDAQSLKEYLNERLSYYEKIYGKILPNNLWETVSTVSLKEHTNRQVHKLQ